MCYRRIDQKLDSYKRFGYDIVLEEMLPGGQLYDREKISRWNRLALAEENDECIRADIHLAVWLED